VKAAEDAALKRAEKVLKREIEPATVAYREMKVLFDIDPVTIQRSGVKPEKETILLPRRGGFVEVHPFRTDKIKNLKRGRRGRAQARHPDRITKREALDTYLIGQKTLYKYRSKKKGGEGKKHRALGSTIHTWIQKDGALEISKEDCELIKAWREARPKTAAAKQFLERELQAGPQAKASLVVKAQELGIGTWLLEKVREMPCSGVGSAYRGRSGEAWWYMIGIHEPPARQRCRGPVLSKAIAFARGHLGRGSCELARMTAGKISQTTFSRALREMGSATPVSKGAQDRSAMTGAPALVLGEFGEKAMVHGRPCQPVTLATHDILKALLEAGPDGLNKDELDAHSGHPNARQYLRRLLDREPVWASIVKLPGRPWGRYRIELAT